MSPSLGLGMGIFIPRTVGGLDPDVRSFKTLTGATDVSGINDLVVYLKAQSLWTTSRFYPMKSSQNYGAPSSVVAGLGGLTANNMTLINSPTRGAGGIGFASASTQYGTIPDFLAAETLTAWIRRSSATGTNSYLICQWDYAATDRSWALQTIPSDATAIRLSRSADGSTTNGVPGIEYYETATGQLLGTMATYRMKWVAGGARSLHRAGSAVATSLNVASAAQTDRKNSAGPILVSAAGNTGSYSAFADQTVEYICLVTGSITSEQTTAIEGLLDAL